MSLDSETVRPFALNFPIIGWTKEVPLNGSQIHNLNAHHGKVQSMAQTNQWSLLQASLLTMNDMAVLPCITIFNDLFGLVAFYSLYLGQNKPHCPECPCMGFITFIVVELASEACHNVPYRSTNFLKQAGTYHRL